MVSSLAVVHALSCLYTWRAVKTYIRVLHDIKTVLAHPWAVSELLTHHLPSLMTTITLLDCFPGYKRKLGDHIEWPNDAWLNPVQLEVILSHLLEGFGELEQALILLYPA